MQVRARMRWEQDKKEGVNKDAKEVGMSSEYEDVEEMCKQRCKQTGTKAQMKGVTRP